MPRYFVQVTLHRENKIWWEAWKLEHKVSFMFSQVIRPLWQLHSNIMINFVTGKMSGRIYIWDIWGTGGLHQHLHSLFKEHLRDSLSHRVTFQFPLSTSAVVSFSGRQGLTCQTFIRKFVSCQLCIQNIFLQWLIGRSPHPWITSIPSWAQDCWQQLVGKRGHSGWHFCQTTVGGNDPLWHQAFFIITMALAL